MANAPIDGPLICGHFGGYGHKGILNYTSGWIPRFD